MIFTSQEERIREQIRKARQQADLVVVHTHWGTENTFRVDASVRVLAQKMVEQGIDFALHLYRSGVHGLATADSQTNGAEALESMSSDVPNWMAEWALFLQERQFF